MNETTKRTIRYSVRFSPDEFVDIKKNSDLARISVSTYLRIAGLNKEIKPRLTEIEQEFYRDLCGQSNNLNQLTKSAKINGLLGLIPEIVSTLNKINRSLDKLRK
jgi:hypothetical protein